MPHRLAALLASFKTREGELPRGVRWLAAFVGISFLLTMLVLFLNSAWGAELSQDLLTGIGMFLVIALLVLGMARLTKEKEDVDRH